MNQISFNTSAGTVFQDILVLDFTTSVAGAYASMYLGDHGADVVICEPKQGHPLRMSAGFQSLQRGKKSIIVYKAADIRPILSTADVILVDDTQAALRGLGLDFDTVSTLNPKIIYVSLPPYGEDPAKLGLDGIPSSDGVLGAVSGMMATQISLSGDPVRHVLPLASYGTGIMVASTVAAVVFKKRRVGQLFQGERAEVSQLAGCFALLHGADRSMLAKHPMGAKGPIPCYRSYKASDNRWFFLACANEWFFKRMLAAVGQEALLEDPRLKDAWVFTNQADGPRDVLVPVLESLFSTQPCAHWLALFEAADVPVQPILSRDEFFDSPYVAENNMKVSVTHPELGDIAMIGVPLVLEQSPGSVQGPAPLLGADQDAVAELVAARSIAAAQATHSEGEGIRVVHNPESASASDSGDDSSEEPLVTDAMLDVPHVTSPFVTDHSPQEAEEASPEAEVPALQPGLLAGVKVLDLSSYIAGPLGPRHLGMLGAEVIKVESPIGDPFRSHKGFPDFNQGKRSLVLNLKTEEARRVFYGIVRHADVVVENFRPDVTARLGVTYDTLRRINPRIIYLSAPGFGDYKLLAKRPAFDPLLQSVSGAMFNQGGGHEDSAPVLHTIPLNDVFTAAIGSFGIIAALAHREITGRGQRIRASLAQTSLAVQAQEFTRFADPSRAVAAGINTNFDVGGEDFKGAHAHARLYEVADGPAQRLLRHTNCGYTAVIADLELDSSTLPSDMLAGLGQTAHSIMARHPRAWQAGSRFLWLEASDSQTQAVGAVIQELHHLYCRDGAESIVPCAEAYASMDSDDRATVIQATLKLVPLDDAINALRGAGIIAVAVTSCNRQWIPGSTIEVSGLTVMQPHPDTKVMELRVGDLIKVAGRRGAQFSAPAPRFAEHTEAILRECGLSDPSIDALVATKAAVLG